MEDEAEGEVASLRWMARREWAVEWRRMELRFARLRLEKEVERGVEVDRETGGGGQDRM